MGTQEGRWKRLIRMEDNKQQEVEKKSSRLKDADEIMIPRTEIHRGVGAAHFCLGLPERQALDAHPFR
jgi:hypothetical protein